MLSLGLDPKSICKFLSNSHANLLNDRKWTPAKRPLDTSKVPLTFATMEALSGCGLVDSGSVSALALLIALLQANGSSGASKTPKTSPCNICGKLGHWVRECPDNGKKGFGKPAGKPKDNPKSHGWKRVPPTPGESPTKKLQNREFRWCAKCKSWSTTHGTDTHTGKKSSDQVAAANLSIDPSLWLNMSPSPLSSDDPIDPPVPAPFSMILTLLPLVGLLCLVSWKQMLPLFATKTWSLDGALVGSALGFLVTSAKLFKSLFTPPVAIHWTALRASLVSSIFDGGKLLLSIHAVAVTLPATVWIVPLLWFGLFMVIMVRHHLIGPAPASKFTRSQRRAFDKLLRPLVKHRRSTPTRLRGRSFHRPNQHSKLHCLTSDQRKSITAQANVIDTGTFVSCWTGSPSDPTRCHLTSQYISKKSGRHRRHRIHYGYKVCTSDPHPHDADVLQHPVSTRVSCSYSDLRMPLVVKPLAVPLPVIIPCPFLFPKQSLCMLLVPKQSTSRIQGGLEREGVIRRLQIFLSHLTCLLCWMP